MNVEALLSHEFPMVEQSYDSDSVIFYALSIGLGADPSDVRQLPFVYEQSLQVFPSMPLVLAHPGFWMADPRFGIDWKRVVHGEQAIQLHNELPTSGRVVSRLKIEDVVNRGAVGTFVYSTRDVVLVETGQTIATVKSTTICRGDIGFGQDPRERTEAPTPPGTPYDAATTLPTFPNSAALYRLNGDRNPLHIDPAVAQEAGFRRPILHGLCTFGVAAHAIIRSFGNYETSTLRSMSARFSAPVYPGEAITTRMWRIGDGVAFEAHSTGFAGQRVLSNGWVDLG